MLARGPPLEPVLRVGGFQPFSATDYPGKLAAVVFCQGCPWRCGYCHNPELIPARGHDEHDFAAIQSWLGSRRGLLDAVVFSGGEPTAQVGLEAAIVAVRARGFAVGLHTGGAYPRRLAKVLRHVDWVGLDIKAPIAAYDGVTGTPGSGIPAFASLELVLASGVPFEVRTTVHPAVTALPALERLACELSARRVERWALQTFRPIGCASEELVDSASEGRPDLGALASRWSWLVPVIEVRE